jgi:hypothetical protein
LSMSAFICNLTAYKVFKQFLSAKIQISKHKTKSLTLFLSDEKYSHQPREVISLALRSNLVPREVTFRAS